MPYLDGTTWVAHVSSTSSFADKNAFSVGIQTSPGLGTADISQNLSSRSSEFFLHIFELLWKYVFWSIINKSGRVDTLLAFPTPLPKPHIFVPILNWNKTSSFLYQWLCNCIFNCMLFVNKNPVAFCKCHVFRGIQFAREGDNLVVSHNVLKYLGYIINKR